MHGSKTSRTIHLKCRVPDQFCTVRSNLITGKQRCSKIYLFPKKKDSVLPKTKVLLIFRKKTSIELVF